MFLVILMNICLIVIFLYQNNNKKVKTYVLIVSHTYDCFTFRNLFSKNPKKKKKILTKGY